MNRFRTGNVFKLNDSIGIVYRVDSELTHWVSFSHQQSSGSTPNVTKPCEEQCWSCDTNISDNSDYDCEFCKGTGYYKSERIGMDRATYLADCVKSYILNRLTKNFEF
jgi:hypothetical protein